jgi:hypothetical protein
MDKHTHKKLYSMLRMMRNAPHCYPYPEMSFRFWARPHATDAQIKALVAQYWMAKRADGLLSWKRQHNQTAQHWRMVGRMDGNYSGYRHYYRFQGLGIDGAQSRIAALGKGRA